MTLAVGTQSKGKAPNILGIKYRRITGSNYFRVYYWEKGGKQFSGSGFWKPRGVEYRPEETRDLWQFKIVR